MSLKSTKEGGILVVSNIVLLTNVLDSLLDARQAGVSHGGEEVVFDLVVQPSGQMCPKRGL